MVDLMHSKPEEEIHDEDSEGEDDADQDEYSRGAPKLPPGITKTVLREAPVDLWELGRPSTGDAATIHFVAKLLDGSVVQNSRDKDEPFTFTIDQTPREVIVGMDMAVLTMRKTEIAEFKIASRFAYDVLGCPPLVPADAMMVFEIELINWETQEDLFKDGLAVKTLVKKGDGKTQPLRGQEVRLSLKCLDRKGQVLIEHEDLLHIVGDPVFGALSRLIVTALLTMSEGERSTIALGRYFAPTSEDRRYAKGSVDVHLKQVLDCCDCSPAQDRSLMKKTLQRGTGAIPHAEGSQVRVRVENATDGEATLYGFVGAKTLDFVVGNGDVCDALDLGVRSMKVNERASLTCSPPLPACLELELGLFKIEAPKAVLTVQLLSCTDSPDVMKLPDDEFSSFVKGRKDIAGSLFKRDRFTLAGEAYKNSFDIVAARFGSGGGGSSSSSGHHKAVEEARAAEGEEASAAVDKPLQKELETLATTCKLNRAACLLKCNQYSEARVMCQEVLAKDPGNAKALYRRATAAHGLSDYEGARQDLNRLLQENPGNVEARRLLGEVKEAQKQYRQDARAAASRMLETELRPREDSDEGAAAAEGAGGERPSTWMMVLAWTACLPVDACSNLWRLIQQRSAERRP